MHRALIACLALLALILSGCGGLDDPEHIQNNLSAKLSIVPGVRSVAVNVRPGTDDEVAIVVFLETESGERNDQLRVMADACKVVITNAPEKGTMRLSAGSAASTMAGTVLQTTDLGFTGSAPTLAQARERCR